MIDPPKPVESPDIAIPRLLAAHGDQIHQLGLRLCDDRDFAQDLVQETFLRAYRNWDSFDGRSAPLTWLYTIASRTCQRLQRRRAGEPRRIAPLNELIATAAETEGSASAWGTDPLTRTIHREEVARLHRAISTLPTAFRLPLVLKELEGLTIQEVAEVLGLKAATVKTRLHRARLSLRKELGPSQATRAPNDVNHSRRQCADLLAAKLEAMARGAPFPIENRRICTRCSATLSALDRTRDICSIIPTTPLPPELRAQVLSTLEELEGPL